MSEYHPYKHGEASKSSRTESTGANDSNLGCPKSTQNTKATKRIRGEIACAECRRLKIKCDRLVPCSTCVKRGCQTLCPNGTIPPGQGSRFVLAATDHLHRKLAKFEARMRSLEDALIIAQTAYNVEPHPLLSVLEDAHTDTQALKAISRTTENEGDVLPDVSGSLHVNGSGINRFFGPSGAPESLLLDLQPREPRLKSTAIPRPELLDNSYLPPEIINFTHAFPFTPPNIPVASTQKSIESFLPPIEKAVTLCDTFLENLSWMFHIVSRQLLISELIPAIYKGTTMYGPHDLALLLIVLAVGVLVDLGVEPYHLESQHFYHLARAALVLQPVMTSSSIVTIKVLHLMSIHNGLSGQESNLEQSYALINLASQVAVQIGFHIDPSSWKFQGREAYDRRVYWWNLLSGILWNSLVTGRPSGISAELITCKIPTMEEEDMYQRGEFPLGCKSTLRYLSFRDLRSRIFLVGVWGFQATYTCLLPLVHITLCAKPPPYEKVLELDAKIRLSVNPKADSDPLDDRTAISMRTFVRSHYSHLMLLYLHRPFFTQAMTEHPHNPLLLSPYSKSVVTAYHAACAVLDDTRIQFQRKPLLVSRVWQIWSFAYSAAVIVGTIATQANFLDLEPKPFDQFETACEVFRGAAEVSNRAAKALLVLDAMLQQAIEVRNNQHPPTEFQSGHLGLETSHHGHYPPLPVGGYRNQHPPELFSRSSTASRAHIPLKPILIPESASLLDPLSLTSNNSNPLYSAQHLSLHSSSLSHPADRGLFPKLSQNWDSEGCQSKSTASDISPHEDCIMHDDRWASLMNFNALDDRSMHPPNRTSAQQF
ncbi:hypothetical protein J3R30DRAFT_16350 [Lentinula aciculospora]|uniref:Zn(2)-C6 fungal-type domain-containing protein n=1 Tax=Lentinula aciculospora TaxID=153920 RepID=A0A9W9AVL1_9AGAR|nr:hypothetical protein J3R30DRAFT_16350 [Lentinula aciculospora]